MREPTLLDPTKAGKQAEDSDNQLRPRGWPIGGFLFLGPTGPGKTRIVEAAAESPRKHPRALDKATLTLGDNRRVDFSSAMVSLTSNLISVELICLVSPRRGVRVASSEDAVCSAPGFQAGASRPQTSPLGEGPRASPFSLIVGRELEAVRMCRAIGQAA
jgi:hypothetical protein